MEPAGIIEPMEMSSSPAIISSPIGNATIPSDAATLSQLAAPAAETKSAPPNTAKKTKTAAKPKNDPVSGRRSMLPSEGRRVCSLMKILWDEGWNYSCGAPDDARLAVAGLGAGNGRVDVGRIDDAGTGQDRRGRSLQPVIDKPVRK